MAWYYHQGHRTAPPTRRSQLALFCAISLLVPVQAHAASFWGREPDAAGQIQFFADIVNEPNSIWTWDENTITYRIDNAFRAAFPDTRIHDQVRLAFQQWDTASTTANGSQFSYFRDNGAQPFGDIRSIAVHELGHILGFGHPNQADDAVPNRNYRLVASAWTPSAAVGTEVMNSFINPGRYNHILSQDELDAYDFAYGTRNLNFVEVGATDTTADITITTYTNTPSNWAQGPPTGQARDPSDPTQGAQIISGVVRWNTNSSDPIGFRTLGINWDYDNASGLPVAAFEVRTRGTNNPTPLFHYDNTGFSNPFDTYFNNPVSANFKDDLLHRWEDPIGGPIPASEVIHVGLEQDVWDWTVVSAQTVSPTNVRTDAPLLSFHDWNNLIVEGTTSLPAGEGIFQGPDERIIATGIRIVAPPTLAFVSNLWIGAVSDLDLQLDQLNRKVFEELQGAQRVFPIRGFDGVLMGQRDDKGQGLLEQGSAEEEFFEDFILVLSGDIEDLPKDIVEKKNFLFIEDIPGVKPGEELLLVAQSESQAGIITTFGLLGAGPIVFDPEILKGDHNLDKKISGLDIDGFVLALLDPEGYRKKTGVDPPLVGDLNGDLRLSGLDISKFVSLLTGKWPMEPDLVSATAPIPEPVSFLLLTCPAALLLGRRARPRCT